MKMIQRKDQNLKKPRAVYIKALLLEDLNKAILIPTSRAPNISTKE